MVDEQVRSQIKRLVEDSNATDNERLLASGILESLRSTGQAHANIDWIMKQIKKLSDATGVPLDKT